MPDFNWDCPHCNRAVTISHERLSTDRHTLTIKNVEGRRSLLSRFIVCPNPQCGRFTLTATLHESAQGSPYENVGKKIEHWNLVPASSAKIYPEYIPAAILQDYREACFIRTLSPKASATLSRRCLQGILRDFWHVKTGRLVDEIEQVKDRIDPLTWGAIDALRKLGNIGAHMEKDINVIIDVDPDEAELLIGLVETLFSEWYVTREERKNRMSALVEAAAAKK